MRRMSCEVSLMYAARTAAWVRPISKVPHALVRQPFRPMPSKVQGESLFFLDFVVECKNSDQIPGTAVRFFFGLLLAFVGSEGEPSFLLSLTLGLALAAETQRNSNRQPTTVMSIFWACLLSLVRVSRC